MNLKVSIFKQGLGEAQLTNARLRKELVEKIGLRKELVEMRQSTNTLNSLATELALSNRDVKALLVNQVNPTKGLSAASQEAVAYRRQFELLKKESE